MSKIVYSKISSDMAKSFQGKNSVSILSGYNLKADKSYLKDYPDLEYLSFAATGISHNSYYDKYNRQLLYKDIVKFLLKKYDQNDSAKVAYNRGSTKQEKIKYLNTFIDYIFTQNKNSINSIFNFSLEPVDSIYDKNAILINCFLLNSLDEFKKIAPYLFASVSTPKIDLGWVPSSINIPIKNNFNMFQELKLSNIAINPETGLYYPLLELHYCSNQTNNRYDLDD